jgi:cyclohexanone monooxygenase
MTETSLDVAIVGAGFAGMYMLHRVRAMGLRARVIEAGSDVGGTWYWNRYPGARCDVESMQYSYQFSDALQQDWDWSERYATQPQILRYALHVADRFDLCRDIQFDTRVEAASFDEAMGRWLIDTSDCERVTATWCVMATGCLSAPNLPSFEGQGSFEGPTYQTSLWPHDGVDFTGQRVAVIGTGSSAVQSIPIIARQAAELYVFQRTANYSIPAHNRPLAPETVRAIMADYGTLRARAWRSPTGVDFNYRQQSALEATAEARQREYQARWAEGGLGFMGAFGDLMRRHDANDTAAEFVRAKIRATVNDPQASANRRKSSGPTSPRHAGLAQQHSNVSSRLSEP